LGSLFGVAAILAGFARIERLAPKPLVRLGILRSGSLIRANIGAMALLGTQFVSTLYMQQLRGWSAVETGLAIFPDGLLIVVLTPRLTPQLVARFGLGPVIAAGLGATAAGYALLTRIGLDTGYATVMLPAYVLVGIGNALAYGPLTVAATNGIAPDEQGLASGLVNTSFQFGGALIVAVVAAVINAVARSRASPAELLDGYRAGLLVPLIAAAIGVVATLNSSRSTTAVTT
jgi:Major Facilitator Superfamily